MSELLPDTELTPELADFGITLLEKIHNEIRTDWNSEGSKLWIKLYIGELNKEKNDVSN